MGCARRLRVAQQLAGLVGGDRPRAKVAEGGLGEKQFDHLIRHDPGVSNPLTDCISPYRTASAQRQPPARSSTTRRMGRVCLPARMEGSSDGTARATARDHSGCWLRGSRMSGTGDLAGYAHVAVRDSVDLTEALVYQDDAPRRCVVVIDGRRQGVASESGGIMVVRGARRAPSPGFPALVRRPWHRHPQGTSGRGAAARHAPRRLQADRGQQATQRSSAAERP